MKHDGFRMMVRRDAAGVRLLTRNGHDWTARFPLIFEAAEHLKRKHPNSTIVVRDLQRGEAITVKYKPDLGPR